MRWLIKELKEQPENIRKFFAWTIIVIFIFIIGFAGLRMLRQEVLVLLNPKLNAEEVALSEGLSDTSSPFSSLRNTAKQLQANISVIFKGSDSRKEDPQTTQKPLPPQILPVYN